jgi:tRNA nucleotidyltransferase (CCA-adding enzyme)
MPDYMFLLESRLSPEQRAVLERVQELSRIQDVNIYLTGGAVRDLISGQPIRDLDFTVEGNPVKMVRELEKGGARALSESERLRHYELIFAGDVDGSLSAARDDYYERPGAKVEYRFSSIMEDLRRRDFSINAIAISLNTQSRGLLLDPTNGLADLEKQEIRTLSIHAFTNQPVRILRALRYAARMGFQLEARTKEWFDLAIERGLHENLDPAEVGGELRSLGREENPVVVLKEWEKREMLGTFHPSLQRRLPDYDSLNKLARVRSNLYTAGLRPRLSDAVIFYSLRRLKLREAAATLRHLEFRAAEIEAIHSLVPETQKVLKLLKSGKTNAPKDAYSFLASLPAETLAFLETEMPHPRAISKIRNFIQKWRPLHLALPIGELDSLGVPRGPRFDKILDQLFELQLRGRGRTTEDRTKLLRQLAGIKEEPKKKPEKEKKKKGKGSRPESKTPEKPAEPVAEKAAASAQPSKEPPPHPAPVKSQPAHTPAAKHSRPAVKPVPKRTSKKKSR